MSASPNLNQLLLKLPEADQVRLKVVMKEMGLDSNDPYLQLIGQTLLLNHNIESGPKALADAARQVERDLTASMKRFGAISKRTAENIRAEFDEELRADAADLSAAVVRDVADQISKSAEKSLAQNNSRRFLSAILITTAAGILAVTVTAIGVWMIAAQVLATPDTEAANLGHLMSQTDVTQALVYALTQNGPEALDAKCMATATGYDCAFAIRTAPAEPSFWSEIQAQLSTIGIGGVLALGLSVGTLLGATLAGVASVFKRKAEA